MGAAIVEGLRAAAGEVAGLLLVVVLVAVATVLDRAGAR